MGTPRTALALLATGLVLAGCGVGTDSAPAARPTPTTAPAGTGTDTGTGTGAGTSTGTGPGSGTGGAHGGAITRPPAAGAGDAAELPAGFPLPPGTKVGTVAVGAGDISATLIVPDGKQVYAYWTAQLPAAGYRVSHAEMVGGIGQITFSGRDCADGSQLGISDQDVSFRCARG
jgi:hypothetical protein